jgi:uncharacterized protein
MTGETNLSALLKTMNPQLNEGDYVFCAVEDLKNINLNDMLFHFKEKEAVTIIVKKEYADTMSLSYSYVAAWITLTVHSSLEAVGLTAVFTTALAKNNISCNAVAAFYHDHIFVASKDAIKAMEVLKNLSKNI